MGRELQRVAYYPGSSDRFEKFKKAFPGVEELGAQPMQTNGFKTQPWLLKTGLTPDQVRLRQLPCDSHQNVWGFGSYFGFLTGLTIML